MTDRPHEPLLPLERRERRVLIGRMVTRVGTSSLVFVLLYAFVPVPDNHAVVALIELIAGLLVFFAVLVGQVRSIVRAPYPRLRAIEAVAIAIPTVIVVFAFTYLSLSKANPGSFSQPLDRVAAMYFTIVTLGTVGYGDITPKTDFARLLVMIQILLDLVLLVGIGRLLLHAARVGVSQRDAAGTDADRPD